MVLGKRKRDDERPANPGGKRRKTDVESCSFVSHRDFSSMNPFLAMWVPAPVPKPRLSPLLRLPAELRTQIWDYAYGNLRVHVTLHSFNKLAEDSHKDLAYYLSKSLQYPGCRAPLKLPPPVCKQFHSEATAAVYASSSFSFSEPHSFRAFALSPHACVSQLQHLSISNLKQNWEEALTPSLVGRLKGLRGVHLTHQHWRNHPTRPLPRATHPHWKSVWRIIRSFQQHKLEANRTSFDVCVRNAFKAPQTWVYADAAMVKSSEAQKLYMLGLHKDFTAGLLQYTPRRLSRRGAESA